VRYAEAASSDTQAAENFIDNFKDFVNSKGNLPQQVFNCDSSGRRWQSGRTYINITAEEKESETDVSAPDTSALGHFGAGRFGAGGKLFVIKPQGQKFHEHLQFKRSKFNISTLFSSEVIRSAMVLSSKSSRGMRPQGEARQIVYLN
jgi:hypothetical protein